MDQRQWKSLLQLLGLGSLAFGLYDVWADYRVIYQANAAMNQVAQGLGVNGAQNMVSSMADGFGYGLTDLLLKSPWLWVGILLIIAPYVVGLAGAGTPTRANPVSAPLDLFVNCQQCGGAVKESAPFCPHCGTARS